MGFIYVIENQINHKKYVGQTTTPDLTMKLHTMYLNYYWCKSVETMGDECSPVGGEIGTPSKCIAPECKSGEEIVHTDGNIR